MNFKSLLCVLVLAAAAMAQETRGTLVGRIADQTGAVIPGATVVVENQATGVKSEITTNHDGIYQVRYLLTGFYQVTVTQAGFKTSVRRGHRRDAAS